MFVFNDDFCRPGFYTAVKSSQNLEFLLVLAFHRKPVFFRKKLKLKFYKMVKLCEKNETYAILNPDMKEMLKIEGNKLVGTAGFAIDRLLTKFDKRR